MNEFTGYVVIKVIVSAPNGITKETALQNIAENCDYSIKIADEICAVVDTELVDAMTDCIIHKRN